MISLDVGVARSGVLRWTPRRLGASLVLWLRGDQVTLASGAVSSWTDLSGAGRHFTQGISSRRPAYVESGIGGRPSVVFDGVNDILNGPSVVDIAALGSAELHGVIRRTEDPPTPSFGYGGLWRLGSPGTTEDYFPNTDTKIYAGFMSSARKSTNVIKGAGYFASARVVSCLSAPNDWRMWLDGTLEYSTGTNTVSASTNGTSTAIGGAPEQPVVRMYGQIAEVIIAAPVLTTEQRTAVTRYLGQRYGITVP